MAVANDIAGNRVAQLDADGSEDIDFDEFRNGLALWALTDALTILHQYDAIDNTTTGSLCMSELEAVKPVFMVR